MAESLVIQECTDVSGSKVISAPIDLLIGLGEPSEYHINKWCVVLYDGKPYPGIILDVDAIDWGIEVKVMHHIGRNRFFCPTAEVRYW
jgi:hypothetical protein